MERFIEDIEHLMAFMKSTEAWKFIGQVFSLMTENKRVYESDLMLYRIIIVFVMSGTELIKVTSHREAPFTAPESLRCFLPIAVGLVASGVFTTGCITFDIEWH